MGDAADPPVSLVSWVPATARGAAPRAAAGGVVFWVWSR